MANISPGIYTKIIDLSTFVQIVPSTIGFICALTEKGEDNKLKFLSSRSELVDEFGSPNISAYGQQYGQGPYVAYNYLGESGSLYFMRCLPDDATYSNLRIYANSDTTTALFIDYVPNLNSTADITTAMQVFGNNTPLVIFYPIGRGTYYNNIGIEITEDETHADEGVYNIDIYETQSDGSYTLIESFKISFDSSAISTNPGESIYVEHVLETYSKVLRAKVGKDGFDLIDKIYTTEVHTITPTGQDVTDVDVSSSGSTSYIDSTSIINIDSTEIIIIDSTTVEHVQVYDGSSWATTPSLNQARRGLAGCGSTVGALSMGGGTAAVVVNTTEKWNSHTFAGLWFTTSSLNQAREYLASSGDTSGALAFGGGTTAVVNSTEKWSGSSWVTTSALNTAIRGLAGCGTVTDTLSIGGGTTTVVNTTEKWNGSSWTTTYGLNQSRFDLAACGTTSDALCFGGGTTAVVNTTEKYSQVVSNIWATTNSMTVGRKKLVGIGTVYDALSMSGSTGTNKNQTTEIWNGSSWATTTNLNYGRYFAAGSGITSDALIFSGNTTPSTEKWNGSTWSTTNDINNILLAPAGVGTTSATISFGGGTTTDGSGIPITFSKPGQIWYGSGWYTASSLNVGRALLAMSGTTSDALAFGGNTAGGYTAPTTATEKFSIATQNNIWATTSNMVVAKQEHEECGDVNSSLVFGGYTTGVSNKTEIWNGSSWATTTNMVATIRKHAGCGTTSNALSFGGQTTNKTEIWNGSSWATTSNLDQNRIGLAGCGTTSDTLGFGGGTTVDGYGTVIGWITSSVIWNGSVWTTTAGLNQPRSMLAGCGITSGALSFGGTTAGAYTGEVTTTELWNGSSWATTTALTVARFSNSGSGNTSSALCFGGGGDYSTPTTIVNYWNGSIWATTSVLNIARDDGAGSGTGSNALSSGGYTGSSVNTTEKYTQFSIGAWSTTSALNLSRYGLAGCGTTNASLAYGGSTGTGVPRLSTEVWNGSSWATTMDQIVARQYQAGCGTTVAALSFGGETYASSSYNTTEIWLPVLHGAWATTSALNQTKSKLSGCGTTTDALSFGGDSNSSNVVSTTEIWNGSSWATTSALNVARQYLAGCGTTSDALSFGGGTTAQVNTTEKWYATYHTNTIVHHIETPEIIHVVTPHVIHTITPVITDVFQLIDNNQDFTPWSTDPETGTAQYIAIVKDSFNRTIWGWLGSTSEYGTVVNIWKNNNLDTSDRGWNGDTSTFDYNDENITYQIKKSDVSIPDLFSVKTLRKGSDGSLVLKGTFDEDIATQILSQGYAGLIDSNVLDIDGTYFSLVYDAGYPKDVKDQIVGLAQARGDCVAIIDNGDNISVNSSILSRKNNYQYNTYYASIFESYNRIFDIFTERQIWFSPCYHLGYILPRNDKIGELWFAASGNNRGSCRDIKELRFSPNQSQRDILYNYQINPIIKQNTDYVLWGQLTSQSKASALQDLNIVRLLLYIKRGVQQYANNFIFDDNSQLVWNTVRNDVTDFLEQIKKRRGLINYTINVGATLLEIKNKTFHVDIILEPTGTTEKIELNFYIK